MDTRTGEIKYGLTPEELKSGFYREIDETQMTPKQKSSMQVSKYDNRSQLGMMFGMNRAERRKQEKLNRRTRKGGRL